MSIPVSQQLKSLVAKIEKNVPTPKVAKAIITDAEKLVDDSKRESREAQLVKALKPVTAVLTGKDDDAKQRVLAQYGVEIDVEPEKPTKKAKTVKASEMATSPTKQRAEKSIARKAAKAADGIVVRKASGELERKTTIYNIMRRVNDSDKKNRARFDVATVRTLVDAEGIGAEIADFQIRLTLANLSLPRQGEVSRLIREDRGVFIVNPTWTPAD